MGVRVNRQHMTYIVGEASLYARRSRKFKVNIDSRHNYLVAPNLFERKLVGRDVLGIAWITGLIYEPLRDCRT